MTAPNKPLPDDVREESIEFHDAEGYPTDDRSKAIMAEITTTYKDGRTEHSIVEFPKNK